MNKKILIAVVVISLIAIVSSCYNNKEDILSLPAVSFTKEVVPIVTTGPCGCHNNENSNNAVLFSKDDTIYYDAILSRVSLFNTWVNGGAHPGGGVVDFTERQKLVIKAWIDQGAKDDRAGDCDVSGPITYNVNIVPIYTSTCKGSSCHSVSGLPGPDLTYNRLVSNQSKLTTMMNSGGSSGHPGGTLSLGSCTIKFFKEWIAQGMLN